MREIRALQRIGHHGLIKRFASAQVDENLYVLVEHDDDRIAERLLICSLTWVEKGSDVHRTGSSPLGLFLEYRHLTTQTYEFGFLVGRQSVAPARVNFSLLGPELEGLRVDAQIACHLRFR